MLSVSNIYTYKLRTFSKGLQVVPPIYSKHVGISDPANTIANTFKDIYVEKEAGQSGNFSHMVPSLIDVRFLIK